MRLPVGAALVPDGPVAARARHARSVACRPAGDRAGARPGSAALRCLGQQPLRAAGGAAASPGAGSMTATNTRPSPDTETIGNAVTAALRTVDANLALFGNRYPADTTVDNRYRLRPPVNGHPEGANVGWT